MSSTTYKCYLNGVRVGLTVRIIDYENYMLKVSFFVINRPRVQVPSLAPIPSVANRMGFLVYCIYNTNFSKSLKKKMVFDTL